MAASLQNLFVFTLLTIFSFGDITQASIENIDLNYTQPAATFDELYNDGIRLYSNESWGKAIRSFMLAIADHRQEAEVRANCIIQCREKVDKSDVLRNGLYDGGSLVLYYVIRVRRCADLCQEKFLGRRGPIAKFVRDAFERREPYNYMQFAFYKIQQYQNAADAALTYLEVHPNDKIMMKNFATYTAKDLPSAVNAKSMEYQHHMHLFLEGVKEYEEEKYSDCTHSFEEALDEYYRAHQKCQAFCQIQHDKQQASFSVALFQHYMAVVQCRLGCENKLTMVNGGRRDKYIEDHYHYLQFCYFESGRVKEAAFNAKTYLLFQPDDPIMNANMEFYMTQASVKGETISARKRAEGYLRQRKLDEKLLAVSKHYANPDEMFDEGIQDLGELEQKDENLIEDDYEKLREQNNEAENKEKEQKKDDQKADDSGEAKPTKKKLRNVVKKVKKWQKNPIFKGARLFQEGKQLNGTERFVVDNIASQEECTMLSKLVEKLRLEKTGVAADCSEDVLRVDNETTYIDPSIWSNWLKLAKFGDGYKHNHADPKHPFTEMESFEGVNIRDSVMAAVRGSISVQEAELYANVSEKMRHFVEDYFEMKTPLHIAYTHLVCRTAYDQAMKGEHISHPVHSDNCVLNGNGPGTCPEVPPAYTWRDYSGVLYLNDDFEGGEFIFANHDKTAQAKVKPKCGRMVAFSNLGGKNLHGVLGVKSGKRCALPLWFTLQGDKVEDNRDNYLEILRKFSAGRNVAGSETVNKVNYDKTTENSDSVAGSGSGQLKSEL